MARLAARCQARHPEDPEPEGRAARNPNNYTGAAARLTARARSHRRKDFANPQIP